MKPAIYGSIAAVVLAAGIVFLGWRFAIVAIVLALAVTMYLNFRMVKLSRKLIQQNQDLTQTCVSLTDALTTQLARPPRPTTEIDITLFVTLEEERRQVFHGFLSFDQRDGNVRFLFEDSSGRPDERIIEPGGKPQLIMEVSAS